MRQTTVIRAEPDSTVTGRPRAHNDIIGQPAIIFREVVHHLVGLGVINKDTGIVGTQPIVTVLVLAGGGNVSKFDALQTGNTRDILVNTVFIGSDPDRVPVVQIECT